MKKILLVLSLFMVSVFADIYNDETRLIAQGKGVMFIFESKSCPYCELLKKDFKENKEMKEISKGFNIYFINQDNQKDYVVGTTKKQETTTTLRMAFMSKTTPNIVMFDKKWNKIFQLPGYAHPAQMITFMKFIDGLHNGDYTAKDWQKYLKDNGVS
ncbi:thioredoxin fold domain-containing protein [Poseidonibacter lekithochrous]|uniref:thioredoxin fold domain-containing protein n=1 Tax=Poseidonibacter lekithochrous TaxID=1904463 RepID=UPI0008FCA0AB|nr:thioredoxin fold domain-containing protein [Poseidonibacter lekithochrous]QKJ22991.1 thioredoxin-related protein, SoxW family [Poseidonibacter lekithochrous]